MRYGSCNLAFFSLGFQNEKKATKLLKKLISSSSWNKVFWNSNENCVSAGFNFNYWLLKLLAIIFSILNSYLILFRINIISRIKINHHLDCFDNHVFHWFIENWSMGNLRTPFRHITQWWIPSQSSSPRWIPQQIII